MAHRNHHRNLFDVKIGNYIVTSYTAIYYCNYFFSFFFPLPFPLLFFRSLFPLLFASYFSPVTFSLFLFSLLFAFLQSYGIIWSTYFGMNCDEDTFAKRIIRASFLYLIPFLQHTAEKWSFDNFINNTNKIVSANDRSLKSFAARWALIEH